MVVGCLFWRILMAMVCLLRKEVAMVCLVECLEVKLEKEMGGLGMVEDWS